MNIAYPALALVLLAVNFLAALACYSLRDFSWSKLEEICRKHGREDRFSTIVKCYENAQLAIELFQIGLLTALVAVVTLWVSGFASGEVKSNPADWLFALRMALLVIVVYISGVMLPWALTRVAGEQFLYRVWPALSALAAAAAPFIWLAHEFDSLLHRLAGLQSPETEDAAATITEEIRSVMDEGQREGVLEDDARTMIHRVMELQDVDVADIMTPRTAMVCISNEDDLEQARQLLLEEGHSRVPVIGKTTDDITGMLYAKDLLRYLDAKQEAAVPLADIVREPFYVPETMGIDTLLKTFKKEHVHLAIVLDEYGGVAGLVTMEDILEEIVGEIVDEYDPAELEEIRPIAPGISEVDARAHIDDVNEKLQLNLPSDLDFDTVGGFVFSLLGRIPVQGEQFTWHQFRFTVLEADKRKIVRLRIEVDESIPATSQE
jgi:CBS domain containing-hemolysin-like protein